VFFSLKKNLSNPIVPKGTTILLNKGQVCDCCYFIKVCQLFYGYLQFLLIVWEQAVSGHVWIFTGLHVATLLG